MGYYGYRFAKCPHCGREFLVDMLLLGTDHTASLTVTCKECFRKSVKKSGLAEEFVKQHPEEAKAIAEWLSKK